MPKSDMVHFNSELNIYHNTEKVPRLCGMLTVRVHAQIGVIPLCSIKLVYIDQMLLMDSQCLCWRDTSYNSNIVVTIYVQSVV